MHRPLHKQQRRAAPQHDHALQLHAPHADDLHQRRAGLGQVSVELEVDGAGQVLEHVRRCDGPQALRVAPPRLVLGPELHVPILAPAHPPRGRRQQCPKRKDLRASYPRSCVVWVMLPHRRRGRWRLRDSAAGHAPAGQRLLGRRIARASAHGRQSLRMWRPSRLASSSTGARLACCPRMRPAARPAMVAA